MSACLAIVAVHALHIQSLGCDCAIVTALLQCTLGFEVFCLQFGCHCSESGQWYEIGLCNLGFGRHYSGSKMCMLALRKVSDHLCECNMYKQKRILLQCECMIV